VKRTLLTAMIITLAACAGCTSAISYGVRTSDDAHSFLLESTQVIDKIDENAAPEEEVFLVIKYEVENLGSQNDSLRRWTDQMKLEADEEQFEPVLVDNLDGQLWETSLQAGGKESGYIAFMVPEEITDFKLTLTFPVSGNEEVYDFRPVDKRIGVNVDYVLTRLEQIERTRRIWLIGKPLAAFSSSPIRYLGTILVPKDEIPDLMEQTEGLWEEAKRAVIEDYLVERGHCRLE